MKKKGDQPVAQTLFEIRDPFRTGKAYTVSQAARLAETSPGTIRNWLFGDRERMQPVIVDRKRAENSIQRLSFLELIDLVVVARYRHWGIGLDVIRDAHTFAAREWNVAHPFASLNLLPLGGQVLRQFEETHPDSGQFVVMSSPGQYVLPGIVLEQVENMDFDDTRDPFAVRWHPYGRDVPVVVDPRFGGGMPTVEGTGVTVDILVKRRRTGETRRSIASDFGLKFSVVEQILKQVA